MEDLEFHLCLDILNNVSNTGFDETVEEQFKEMEAAPRRGLTWKWRSSSTSKSKEYRAQGGETVFCFEY